MVHVVQCACPAGHLILDFAYLKEACPEGGLAEAMRDYVELRITRRQLDPQCPVCRSEEFVYEDTPTGFATIKEARARRQG